GAGEIRALPRRRLHPVGRLARASPRGAAVGARSDGRLHALRRRVPRRDRQRARLRIPTPGEATRARLLRVQQQRLSARRDARRAAPEGSDALPLLRACATAAAAWIAGLDGPGGARPARAAAVLPRALPPGLRHGRCALGRSGAARRAALEDRPAGGADLLRARHPRLAAARGVAPGPRAGLVAAPSRRRARRALATRRSRRDG